MEANSTQHIVITFDTPLHHSEVPAFRGAINKKLEQKYPLFHNHFEGKNNNFRYRPIQYKSIRRKAAIVCLGEGVAELSHLFDAKNWKDLNLNGKSVHLEIDSLYSRQYTPVFSEKLTYTYFIKQWFALKDDTYAQYKALQTQGQKLTFLERMLTNHVVTFLKSCATTPSMHPEVVCSIQQINREYWVPYKRIRPLVFDLSFQTNVLLPQYIGLGSKVSIGFGAIRKNKTRPSFYQ